MKTEENTLPGIRKIKQSDYWIFDTLHYIWRKRTSAAVKYPYPARHYGGHVKEKKGDWIRFDDLRAINKLAVPFSGWTEWRENDTILFEVLKMQ